MDKEKFNRAIELNKKIEEYKSHKTALESYNIKYGGGLIFTYNRMHNDVPLKEEIFGKNFFQNYMNACLLYTSAQVASRVWKYWLSKL